MNFKARVLPLLIAATLAACGGSGQAPAGQQQLSSAAAPLAAPVAAANTTPDVVPGFVVAQQTAATAAASGAAIPETADAGPALSTLAISPTSTAATISSTTTGAVAERGMWSWVDSDISTVAKQTKLINFATLHRVTVIYLHSEGLLAKPALLRSFIALAAQNRIGVELLFGNPDWALSANHSQAVALLKKAETFISGSSGARPVGIHFDIEPHSMPNWSTETVSLGNQLIDLYQKLAAAKPAGIYINADIAMGYEYVSLTRGGVTKTMSQWMVDVTDRTTLMAYRDYALGEDSIVSHARHTVDYATLRGKRSVIGVESTCNLTPVKITFCEEGDAKMEIQLSSVNQSLQSSAGYGGVAVHDYQHYRVLK